MSGLHGVVLPDIHIPFHDEEALGVALQRVESKWWDFFCQVGDLIDFDIIGRFVDGKPGKIDGRALEEDYEIARRVYQRIAGAARKQNPDCRLVQLEGNHEARAKSYIDKHPILRGSAMFDVPTAMNFEELGVQWVQADTRGEVFFPAPGVGIIHGWYHGVNHAKKTLEEFDRGDIYYGHTHDMQLIIKSGWSKPDNYRRKRRGGSLGCLCSLEMEYTHGRPTRWQHGFAEFCFDSDGPYSVTPVMIDAGKMVVGDLFYGER